MTKRFALVLVALLVVPLLLTACSSDSKDAAQDYMEAVLEGDAEKAAELACESFQDETEFLLAYYPETYAFLDQDSIDLKYDTGKGNNQKEIIVTGSFKYGADPDAPGFKEDDQREFEITQEEGTRIVLWMEEDGDDWCVTDESEIGEVLGDAEGEEEAADEEADMADDEPEAEMTEEPAADATEEAAE